MFTSSNGPRHRSATSEERRHILLLLEVARLYWEQGLDQRAVADRVGYSRATVSRLLSEARRRGIVQVRVDHPLERVMGLENELRKRYGLLEARVAEPTEVGTPESAVARCAADLVSEHLHPEVMLAISNGSAVAATVAAMPELELPRSKVVQMIGSLGRTEVLLDSPETCRNMAGRLGGRYHALPVPLVVRSAAVARALRDDSQVATTLELAARADLALVGVGAVSGGHSGLIFSAYEDLRTEQALRAAGAVGHISGHHFDRDGNHLRTGLCERTIAVEPERMRQVGLVIAVAWGAEKLTALRGALTGRFASGLVTDRETATALLAGE